MVLYTEHTYFSDDCYLHNVELNDLHSSSNTLPMVKYRRIMGGGGGVM